MLPRSSRLTLGRMMLAVGILAIAFAFLPWALSAALAVAIFGILGLDGLRLSPLSGRDGVRYWLAWSFWCLSLAACPVAMAVIGTVYGRNPPTYSPIRTRATEWVDALCYIHLGVSVLASMAVVLLARPGLRWSAWAAILAFGVFAAFIGFCALMSTTGDYF